MADQAQTQSSSVVPTVVVNQPDTIPPLVDVDNVMDPAWTAEQAILRGYDKPEEYTRDTNQLPYMPGLTNKALPYNPALIKYEADPELNEIDDRVLRETLYDPSYRVQTGAYLKDVNELPVNQSYANGPPISPIHDFEESGLATLIVKNIVNGCKYEAPSQIQAYTIPAILNGNEDLFVTSQPGTGKTAAFVCGISTKLLNDKKHDAAVIERRRIRKEIKADESLVKLISAKPYAMIIVPTHELAFQVFDELRRINYGSTIRPCVLIGGEDYGVQLADLSKGCDILVATCGRLLDFLRNKSGFLVLKNLHFVVIDEADHMILNDDHEELRSVILDHVVPQSGALPPRMLMFSATLPKAARQAARDFTSGPVRQIQIGGLGTLHQNIAQLVYWVNPELKVQALMQLLLSLPACRTLIFVNTQHRCNEIEGELVRRGIPACAISGERKQNERENAMITFRSGHAPIMVATPAAERGLDVAEVLHVINLELPGMTAGSDPFVQYIHRAGRTGRMGNRGQCTTFYNEGDDHLAPALAKCLVQNNQPVPDFLESYRPEGNIVDWDDASDAGDDDGLAVVLDDFEFDDEQLAAYIETGIASPNADDGF